MSINLPLLKELCETAGAPGREERIREIVVRELGGLCDDVTVDAIGNVTGVRKGKAGGRFMTSGHMDEIAFMVRHIDEKGFLHFVPLGGFDPKTLTAQRVTVHGREDLLGAMGSKPIHIMSEEDRKKPLKIDDYYIDVGLPAEKAQELVRPGDVVTRERTLEPMGDLLNGKNFDDRVGVFVAIEGLRAASSSKMDVYTVASTQEEVGIRGATVAAHNIDPDVGVAIDVTLANDVPFTKPHEQVTELGKGTAIKAHDSSVLPN
jgi:endoglucanase